MGKLIIYRNQELTAKEISKKYDIILGSVYGQLYVGGKLKGHEIYWAEEFGTSRRRQLTNLIKCLHEEMNHLHEEQNSVTSLISFYEKQLAELINNHELAEKELKRLRKHYNYQH